MTELGIPTKELVEDFEWPLSYRNSGSSSEFSRFLTEHAYEEDARRALAKAAAELQGPFLVSAVEAIHTLLGVQKYREWEDDA